MVVGQFETQKLGMVQPSRRPAPIRRQIRDLREPKVKLKHVDPATSLRSPGMTVCAASLFLWNVSTTGGFEWAPAFVIASDRMHTDSGLEVEYLASRYKAQVIDKTHMVFVAGDMTMATEALLLVGSQLRHGGAHTTSQIAEAMGSAVEIVRRQRAAKMYLAPLGLTDEVFSSPQPGQSDDFLRSLADQMQRAHFECHAIVVGCDGNIGGLYYVDPLGTVTNHFNIGFLSIGVGGIHSSAQFMNEPFEHDKNYYKALYSTFVAKKRGEVAPGVGDTTDIFRITPEQSVKIPDQLVRRLEKLYQNERKSARRVSQKAAQKIVEEEQRFFASQAASPVAPEGEATISN